MRKIRVAIAGVGNCASSLVQGLEYYKGRNEGAFAGVMHSRIGDWGPSDIEIVAAFDIDRRKVGKGGSDFRQTQLHQGFPECPAGIQRRGSDGTDSRRCGAAHGRLPG